MLPPFFGGPHVNVIFIAEATFWTFFPAVCVSVAGRCVLHPVRHAVERFILGPPHRRWRLIASDSCCDLSRRDRSSLRRTDDTTEWSCAVATASLLNQQWGVCPPSSFALSLSHHILLFLQEGGHGVCIFIFRCVF